jgi:transcriptional regulator with XRE-family HTH domain
MVIGDRVRLLREQKSMSQGEIEKRSGLLRCYISRVENGHTVPSLDTLAKFARALEVPLYQFFYDGEEPPKEPPVLNLTGASDTWGSVGKPARFLSKLRRLLARISEKDRALLISIAQRMSVHKRRAKNRAVARV